MSQRPDPRYEFGDGVPVGAVDAGTTLLVAGPAMSSAHSLGLRLLLGGDPGDGRILVTVDDGGEQIIERCAALGADALTPQFHLVDATGRRPDLSGSPVNCRTVSSPEDLTGIGIEFSAAYERLHEQDCRRVRTGFFSLSALLARLELRTVFRFVHTVTGRIASADGLGVFLLDPTAHDDQAVQTVARIFDGRIDVRDADGPELRIRGLEDQRVDWTGF